MVTVGGDQRLPAAEVIERQVGLPRTEYAHLPGLLLEVNLELVRLSAETVRAGVGVRAWELG